MENNKSNIGFSVFSGAIKTGVKILSADANINAVIYSGENSI